MYILSEEEVERFLSYAAAIAAVEKTFADSARGETATFTLVRTPLRGGRSLVGVKSGCNYEEGQLGLKAGGYWNDNAARHLDRHQSTVLLLDLQTGRPLALVAGNNLTAIRTAAASAVAARHLARANSSAMALLGTGRQALFQLQALCQVLPIRAVSAWSLNPLHVAEFGASVRKLGLTFVAATTPAEAVRAADVVVTVTPSRQPLLRLADLKPGTHICAMGSDTAGKQELASDLLQGARLFVDDAAQACCIGESQHLTDAETRGGAGLITLGEVILGRAPGRRHADEITVFDGTGLAIQDLAAAHTALNGALAAGTARSVNI